MILRISVSILTAGLLIFGGAPALEAQMSLSPDQLRAVQNLSPQQRAAILEAVQGRAEPSEAAKAADDSLDGEEVLAAEPAEEEEDEELRIRGNDTIVVTTKFREEFEAEDFDEFLIDVNRLRLLGSNALRLDRYGVLDLPGIARIPLAGLSAEEVSIRLASEPLLALLEIEVTILPVEPTGPDALQPFGYSLFDNTAELAGPGVESDRSDIRSGLAGAFGDTSTVPTPVPRDYVLGPGDQLKLQFYGEENYESLLPVNPDGTINVPRVGPRVVAGLTFAETKAQLEERVAEQLIGTSVSVSMGELRSIRVFVVGDVKRPGAYTISGLSRITHALFASGGITEIGSLRRVQLKRSGRVAASFDLYRLLLDGDAAGNLQLQSDDVVFVPPAEVMVGFDGEVRRPAIYELSSGLSIGQGLELAGGLLPEADRSRIQIERISAAGRRQVQAVDARSGPGLATPLRAGDLVRVFPVLDELADTVYVDGHVHRPGGYEWRPGLRLSDLLPDPGYLRPRADLGYVLIRREEGVDRTVRVLSADLSAALANPGSGEDPLLEPRDRLTLFELGVGRSAAVKKILEELDVQATRDVPMQVVRVSGRVRAPGKYPLEQDMRISDLLRAGGGLDESAFAATAELTRFTWGPNGERRTELLDVDLDALRTGQRSADLELRPYDYLNIREIPEWQEQVEVELIGEVRFPGLYPVRRGETLSSVIARAGGLTDQAFPEGGIFTRETLKQREGEQIEQLTRRLESDLASLALQAAKDPQAGARAAQASSIGEGLLQTLRSVEPTGRLVINLPDLLRSAGDPARDIVLRDGDTLLVPMQAQEVTVIGEVQYATSHFYDPSLSRDGYIRLSGGTTVNADPKRIYVVRANGAVEVRGGRSRWFRRGGSGRIQPGDTVVVPLDTDRLPSLTQWASITQIIYNLALAAAAINSF